ncbi:NADH-quinone oxidoreductase subunit A [Acetobacteraceae bacterium EV16G]|uniref:NADH-quinone oxidoreductase subunit A n=1 Tax=Sorlinia euscelidii TaxID=3081148 RepID=A0ABU7TZK5_9PROT
MTQIFVDHALLIYIAFTVVFLCIVVALSAAIGPRRVGAARGRSMSLPYESGIMETGSARLRLPAQYYLLAVFFVIFDVEGVFIYVWATVTRQMGWPAFITIVSFIVFLTLALVYLWRSGALEWGPKLRRAKVRLPQNTPAELVKIPKREV